MVPFAIAEFGALMVIDCSVTAATATIKVTLLDAIPFWEAVMILDPAPTPVLTPPALMLATAGFEELHPAELVRSCVVPSLNVPIAVN